MMNDEAGEEEEADEEVWKHVVVSRGETSSCRRNSIPLFPNWVVVGSLLSYVMAAKESTAVH